MADFKQFLYTGSFWYFIAAGVMLFFFGKKIVHRCSNIRDCLKKRDMGLLFVILFLLYICGIIINRRIQGDGIACSFYNICSKYEIPFLILFIVLVMICSYLFKDVVPFWKLAYVFFALTQAEFYLHLPGNQIDEDGLEIGKFQTAYLFVLFIVSYVMFLAFRFVRISKKHQEPVYKTLYPGHKRELDRVMKALDSKQTGSFWVMVRGEKNDKRNFMDHMVGDLEKQNEKVIHIYVKADQDLTAKEMMHHLSKNMQDKMKAAGFYFGFNNKVMEMIRELVKKWIKIGFIELLINRLEEAGGEELVERIQEVLSAEERTEYIFVEVLNIKEKNVEEASFFLAQMKEKFNYPRFITAVAWSTKLLESIKKNNEDLYNDVIAVYDVTSVLHRLGYKEIFDYRQNQDNVWKGFGEPLIDVAGEVDKLLKSVPDDYVHTFDGSAEDLQAERKVRSFGKAVTDRLKTIRTTEELYDNLLSDVKKLAEALRSEAEGLRREFLEEFEGMQGLLVLNLIRVFSKEVFPAVEESGFSGLENLEWKNIDDEMMFVIFYLYSEKHSGILHKRKQFIEAFCQGKIDGLYKKSQNQKNYRKFIRQKEFDSIDIEEALCSIIFEHAVNAREEDTELIKILITEAFPRRAEMNHDDPKYIWKVIKKLFENRNIGGYLLSDLLFWKSTLNIVSKFQIADLEFVRKFYLEILQDYIPQALGCFQRLFEYRTNAQEEPEMISQGEKSEWIMEERLGRIVCEYGVCFDGINVSGGVYDALKWMIDKCGEDMEHFLLSSDPDFHKALKLAKLQMEELCSLRDVFAHMLWQQIMCLIEQHSLEHMILCLDSLVENSIKYTAGEKGQICGRIETAVKVCNLVGWSNEDKELLCNALTRFEQVYKEDFSALKRWVMHTA